jgi:hypothetical protein
MSEQHPLIQQYHSNKPEGDIDLISVVEKVFTTYGIQDKIPVFRSHRHVIEAQNKSSVAQRWLLNNYFRLQILSVGTKSGSLASPAEARYCLIDNGSIDDWIKLFNQNVMPFLLENKLPVHI